MCGISVLFHKQYISPDLYEQFIISLKKIEHRGPDDEGVVLINTTNGNYKIVRTDKTHAEFCNITSLNEINLNDYNLIFGHKRLSILDLSVNGHQPMQGHDGSWIVFNGEIYNYIELREELKLLGCHFKTNSDTEVLLEAYKTWGIDCQNKFNGMWSFCLWDNSTKKIVISNDRFGVKPLYHYERADCFLLFSEIKQINAFSNFKLQLNQNHINDFINFGFLDTNQETIYENVNRFKKSNFIEFSPVNYSEGVILKNQTPYYILKKSSIDINEKDAIDKFRAILYDAVKIRMRADVDFGFALSGGIDSSAVLYMARNINKDENRNNELLGFSAIFPEHKGIDESPFVKIVTNDLPCKTYYSKAMDEFTFESFENHIYHQDGPMQGTSYLAQWSVYKKAQEAGIKILFNGQGADEVFAGYHHHFYRYCRYLLMQGKVIEYLCLVNTYCDLKQMPKSKVHKIVMNEIKLSTKIKLGVSKFDHQLLKYWNEIDTLDELLLRDFDTYQLPLYLRADDRDSMAFSIESRHPFMDYRLVEFGYSLPNKWLIKNGWQKYIIRESMSEMPESIRYRKDKKGFVTPQDEWIKNNKTKFDEYLNYNYKILGNKTPSKNDFYNYTLGCWFKVNRL